MIRWSFWVDSWEHPFSAWSRNTSVKAFVEPATMPILAPPSMPPQSIAPDKKPKPKWKPTTSWRFPTWNWGMFFSQGKIGKSVTPWYEVPLYTDLDRALDEREDTTFTEAPVWDDVNQVWATTRAIGGMFTGGYWAKMVFLKGAMQSREMLHEYEMENNPDYFREHSPQ